MMLALLWLVRVDPTCFLASGHGFCLSPSEQQCEERGWGREGGKERPPPLSHYRDNTGAGILPETVFRRRGVLSASEERKG